MMNGNRYEITPCDGRKSFYGKAYAQIIREGAEVLLSYGTPVIAKVDGVLYRLWDDWSATTGRHIRSFAGIGKADWDKMQTVPLSYVMGLAERKAA